MPTDYLTPSERQRLERAKRHSIATGNRGLPEYQGRELDAGEDPEPTADPADVFPVSQPAGEDFQRELQKLSYLRAKLDRERLGKPVPSTEMQGPEEPAYNRFRRGLIENVFRPAGEFISKHPALGPISRALSYPGEHIRGKIAKGSWGETAGVNEARQALESKWNIAPPQSQQAEDVRNIATGLLTDPQTLLMGARLPKGKLPPKPPPTEPPLTVYPHEAPPGGPQLPPPPQEALPGPRTGLPYKPEQYTDAEFRDIPETPLEGPPARPSLPAPAPKQIPYVIRRPAPDVQGPPEPRLPSMEEWIKEPAPELPIRMPPPERPVPRGTATLFDNPETALSEERNIIPTESTLPGELFSGQDVLGKGPIIGHDVNPITAETEAPLFSRAAQEPMPEQGMLAHFASPYPEELTNRAYLALEDLGGMGVREGRGGFKTFSEAELGGGPEVGGVPSLRAQWYRDLTGPVGKGFHGTRLEESQIKDVLSKIVAGEPMGRRQQHVVNLITEAINKDKGINERMGAIEPRREPALPSTIESTVEHFDTEDVSGLEKLKSWFKDVGDNETGRMLIDLGENMGPIAKHFLNGRRVAEVYPEYKPVYEHLMRWEETEANIKHDLLNVVKPYAELPEALKVPVDEFLRARRRGMAGQIPATFTPEQRAAVMAHDQWAKQGLAEVNIERQAQGMQPITPMQFYTPFMRTGDFLVIREANPMLGLSREVYAFPTPKVAHEAMKALDAQEPQAMHRFKKAAADDQVSLDFGQLHLMEQAGLLPPGAFEKAVDKFGLNPGFAAHFQHAMNVIGEETNLTSPIARLTDGIAQHVAKLRHAGEATDLAQSIKSNDVRAYAQKTIKYVQEHPKEFSNLRAFTATWDLGWNAASMLQNATQVVSVGIPVMQRAFGPGVAKDLPKLPALLWHARKNPGSELGQVLAAAERDGATSPINAMELWGKSTAQLSSFSPFSEMAMRAAGKGSQLGASLVGPLDFIEKGWRGTADSFQAAIPVLMAGYGGIEKINRELMMVWAYQRAKELGRPAAEAYQTAKNLNRDTNFDYSRFSRAPAFRGTGAPLGLFATFNQEYLSLAKQLLGDAATGTFEAMKQRDPRLLKAAVPAATLLGIYLGLAGGKGVPGAEAVNTRTGGKLRESMPAWAWHGPAGSLTGLELSSKYQTRAPLAGAVDPGRGELDFSAIPMLGPPVSMFRAGETYLRDPSASTAQKALETASPPAARNVLQAGRWLGLGPAGREEGGPLASHEGFVGTPKGHTPGPTDKKHQFFEPSLKDIGLKAVGFSPLPLSSAQEQNIEQQMLQNKMKGETTAHVNQAARDLQLRGMAEFNRPDWIGKNLSATSQRELRKAYNEWLANGRRGSVMQWYRKAQEPPIMTPEGQKIPNKKRSKVPY